MLDVIAGFVVGATPSLIAPDESNVNEASVFCVDSNPPFEYFVVTLTRYVVEAVKPPNEVWLESVYIVCKGFKNVVSEFEVIITRYESTLLSAGAIQDTVAMESVEDTDRPVTTDVFTLVSLIAIGLFEQLMYD
jgi:hypothetical protein